MDFRDKLASVRQSLAAVLLLAAGFLAGAGRATAQNCSAIIVPDTLAAVDNGGEVPFCAAFDYRVALRSERYLDGVAVPGFAEGCDYDTLVFYPYFTFPYQGSRGPYVLEEWTVNGRATRDTFANVSALIVRLNVFDPGGNWTNDPITKNIIGGVKGRRYGAMKILHIADGIRREVAPNYQAIAGGTRVTARGAGFHVYTIFDARTNCRDTLVLFVKPNLPPLRDTVYTREQTLSRQFCLDNSRLIGVPQGATRCGGTVQGRVTAVSPYCFTYAPAPGFSGSEEICLEVCDDTRLAGGPVCQRTIVTVVTGGTRRPTTDTVRITIAPRDTSICLDDVLQIARPIESARLCDPGAAGVTVVPLLTGCVDLNPQSGFAGLSQSCIVHCAQGACDTTQLFITVLSDCTLDILPLERDSIADTGAPTAYCLGVSPQELPAYELSIDGVPYTGRRDGCDPQRQYVYNYGPLYQRGQEGPYTLLEWPVDDASFGTRFADITELVAFMRLSDPLGDWRLDSAAYNIDGGRASGRYGTLQIIHDASGIRSELVPNPVDVPMGTSIDLPGRGTYSVTLVDRLSGCRDAVVVKVGTDLPPGKNKTLVVRVAYERPSARTCLFDAVKNQVSRCGSPRNGTATLDAEACVTYLPKPGFVGRDTLCVINCTVPGGAPCDTTIAIFEVTRATLVTDTVRVQSFGESPTLACATLPFDGPFLAARFCGTTGPFTAREATGTCVEITPQAGADRGGQICVEWCAVADPSYCQRVVFVVQLRAACTPDVLAQDSLLLPPSSGSASVCLGDGVDLRGYVVTVNGDAVTPGADAGCGTTVTTGGGGGSRTVHSYSTVFLNENRMRIEGWDIGGELVSGVEVNGIKALADSMSARDPNATWRYDPDAAAILADVNTGSYTRIILFDLVDGSLFQLPLESASVGSPGGASFVPGSVIEIPTAGRYLVTVAKADDSCGDQQLIYRRPQLAPRRDTVRQEVIADQTNGEYCLDLRELNSPAASIRLCGGPAHGVVGFAGNSCYTYTPAQGYVGGDTACVVICAAGGLECDTTTVLLNVILAPAVAPTKDTVTHLVASGVRSQFYCLDEVQLGAPATRRTSCGETQRGSLDFDSVSCYSYTSTPGFVGVDWACAVLCAGTVCDTTVLRFVVSTGPVTTGPVRDTLRLTMGVDELNGPYCLSAAELPGAPTDLYGCGLPRTGNLTFVSESCFTFSPEPGFVGRDTACLVLCSGRVCDTTVVIVTVQPGGGTCGLPLAVGLVTRAVNCDADLVDVCLPTSLEALAGFEISIDGEPYTGALTECGSTERLVFDLADLGVGPFQVDSFRIGEGFLTARVATLRELADSISARDLAADWRFNPASATIVGGAMDRVYGTLDITEVTNSRVTSRSGSVETVAAGVSLKLPLGATVRNLRFSSQAGSCRQDVQLLLTCVGSDAEDVTLAVDAELLYCVDVSELNGAVVSLTDVCPATDSIAGLDFDAVAGCVTLRGTRPGTRRVCLVACDGLGTCDTTFVNVTVTGAVTPQALLALDDRYRITADAVLVTTPTDNDTFAGPLDVVRLLNGPSQGTASMDATGELTYAPNVRACDFSDTLVYEICQGAVCDQATVSIRVRCGLVEVYRGFSPNGDGVNDFFVIEGIEDYPESALSIYNRWGNQVLATKGYRNDWGGTWTDRILVTGTYFYVLQLPGEEPMTGWVELAR